MISRDSTTVSPWQLADEQVKKANSDNHQNQQFDDQ